MKTFWLVVLLATLGWYCMVTIQVIRKGWRDVQQLIKDASDE